MLKNINNLLFIFMLIFSVICIFSSNSWISCWFYLEMNLLSVIPVLNMMKNLYSSESSLKYFLIQVFASINLLFIILLYYYMNYWNNFILYYNNYFYLMINLILMLKMGIPPFHYWLLHIINSLNWMNCFIVLVWQKIAPLIMMSYYMNVNFLLIIIMFSLFISSVMSLNQISLRKLMIYSSINHLMWMISSMFINEVLWLMYYMLYFMIIFMLFYMFNIFNNLNINQFFLLKLNFNIKFYIFLNMLSMIGLPPMLGFMLKLILVNFFLMSFMYNLSFILIMFNLIIIFFYLRILYILFYINKFNIKLYLYMNMMNLYYIQMFSFMNLYFLIFMFLIFMI